MGASLVGGHTEITHGLDRPILVGTLIGEVDRDRLVKPDGAQSGARLLLTKGAPIAPQAGIIPAMHDPTEGGIYTALWEMSQACGTSFRVNVSSVPVPELSR